MASTDKKPRCVLVCDFQGNMPYEHTFVERLKGALDAWRETGVDVINLVTCEDGGYHKHLHYATRETYWDSSVSPDTDILSDLRKYEEVYVVGGLLENKVLATCIVLQDWNINFKIMWDLCHSGSQELFVYAAWIMQALFGHRFCRFDDEDIKTNRFKPVSVQTLEYQTMLVSHDVGKRMEETLREETITTQTTLAGYVRNYKDYKMAPFRSKG